MKPQIIFFGNEKLATGIPDPDPVILQAIERAGFEVEAIITGKVIPKHKAELAVLAAYGQILPNSVLDEFPLGIINVHPSLLPIYRGPTPIEQAILDDVPKTGVSIMKIVAEMDAGPIYKQKSLALLGTETKDDLAQKLQKLGAEMLAEVLPGIADGSIKGRPQPHPDRDASYTRLIKKADGVIDWAKPAARLEREIRAYLGWPGSRTKMFDKDITITAAHVSDSAGELSNRCGDGKFLIIDRLTPSGKKEMTAADFLRGLKN